MPRVQNWVHCVSLRKHSQFLKIISLNIVDTGAHTNCFAASTRLRNLLSSWTHQVNDDSFLFINGAFKYSSIAFSFKYSSIAFSMLFFSKQTRVSCYLDLDAIWVNSSHMVDFAFLTVFRWLRNISFGSQLSIFRFCWKFNNFKTFMFCVI